MLKKITGTTLYEQVVEQIKSMIMDGFYKKGDMLPSEKELMQLTGVSRITVREALHSLAEVGIIETRHGKGSFVLLDAADLSPDVNTAARQAEYREHFLASTRARLLLEPELARQAARSATPEQLTRLEKALDGCCGRSEHDFDSFHRIIAEMAGNALLLEFMDHLLELERQGRSAFALTLPEEQKKESAVVDEEHRKIFEAIRDGDEEFAYFYMREHTRHLLYSYEAYFQCFC